MAFQNLETRIPIVFGLCGERNPFGNVVLKHLSYDALDRCKYKSGGVYLKRRRTDDRDVAKDQSRSIL